MKKTLSLALAVLMLLSLCACGISEDELVGTWAAEYTYDGNDFYILIILDDSGEYIKHVEKNGSSTSIETGDYELKGNALVLYDDAAVVHHGIMTEYKWRGGGFVNGGHKYIKID